ncbi:MAG: ribose-phosphate diphosphokinase [Candidatus Aenigmatarchaeota archaeon]
MNPKPYGLAVPDYSELGIDPPYFGDAVWARLKELDAEGTFEYIPMKVVPFPDGAEKVVVQSSCRDKVVYAVHSWYVEPPRHVVVGAEICDALMRSDASKVYMIELFNTYYRQDAQAGREPITARLVAEIYHGAGMAGLFTADPHSKQLAGFFRNMQPLPMSGKLAERVKARYDTSNAVVVAPDHGGYTRAEHFANLLDLPLAVLHKERRGTDSVKVKSLLGDVSGKDVFLRDDIISTGSTNIEAAKELRARGARSVYAVATHLALSGDARRRLREHGIHVIGTNTIPRKFSDEEKLYFDVADVSDLIANVIYAKSKGGSISHFFNNHGQTTHLRSA